MRLWSIHPKYLDTKGIVAVWREALLAKKVLEKRTKGYKNHPQLFRFKQQKYPLAAINTYLHEILKEAKKRKYIFDKMKIANTRTRKKMHVSEGQLLYEFEHLKKKVKKRAPQKYEEMQKIKKIIPHPLFKRTKGNKASWEK